MFSILRLFAATGLTTGLATGLMAAALWAPQAAGTLSPSQQNSLSQAEAGLEGPDAVRQMVAGIVADNDKLKPALTDLNPQTWQAKGAPSTYVIQWQLAQRQVNDIDLSSKLLLQHVESLASAMDFYFRLEALETTARALNEGAQQYGEGAPIRELNSFVAKNFDSRQRFRDYLRELSINVEQNYKIADEEAQRCRAAMSKTAPCTPRPGGKRG